MLILKLHIVKHQQSFILELSDAEVIRVSNTMHHTAELWKRCEETTSHNMYCRRLQTPKVHRWTLYI